MSWPFEDPALFEGTRDERLAKYREVRDGIEHFIRDWLDDAAVGERRAWQTSRGERGC